MVEELVEAVDVARLLKDMELQYRPLAKTRGLALRARSAPGLEPVQSGPPAAGMSGPNTPSRSSSSTGTNWR